MSRILFAAKHLSQTLSQTQLDDIAHGPTIVCRSRGGLSAYEKEEHFASNDNKLFFIFSVCETAQRGSLIREML